MAPFRCCAALVLCSTASAFVARPLALLQGSGCTARGPGALGVQQPCRAVLTRRPARRRPLLHVLAYSKGGGPDGDSGGSPDAADPATVNFADGLREHLAGIWGPTGGEDFSLYSPDVEFKDPLASYRGIDTYKQALLLLKDSKISSGVQFQTHDVSIAGKGNVRARWVVFTGVSIYTLDGKGKVAKHVDVWDSCAPEALPLFGGIKDILFGGAGLWRAQPDPSYYLPPAVTLYRGTDYELRRLEDYRTVEMDYVSMPRSNKAAAVRSLNTYWAGANADGCVLPASQPTLVVVDEPTLESSKTIACFLPHDLAKGAKAAPEPVGDAVRGLRFAQKNGGLFAVKRIENQLDPLDGWVSTEAVFGVRQRLLRRLEQDGVKASQKFWLARYAQVYGEGETIYELWVPVQSLEMRAAPMLSAAARANVDLSFLKEDLEE